MLGYALQCLLDRDDVRQEPGRAARAQVRAEFTADRMAERVMELYEEVVPLRRLPFERAA